MRASGNLCAGPLVALMERLRLLNRVDLALMLVDDSPGDASDLKLVREVLLAPCDPRLSAHPILAELPAAFDAAERLLSRARSTCQVEPPSRISRRCWSSSDARKVRPRRDRWVVEGGHAGPGPKPQRILAPQVTDRNRDRHQLPHERATHGSSSVVE
jgi:hypothetical protein